MRISEINQQKILWIVMGLIVSSLGLFGFIKKDIKPTKITEFAARLKTKPILKSPSEGNYYDFYLEDIIYPFRIEGFAYQASNKYLISNLSEGDSLYVGILNDSYQSYIVQRKEMAFLRSTIMVLTLKIKKSQKVTTIDLETFNLNQRKDSNLAIIAIIAGVFMMLGTLFSDKIIRFLKPKSKKYELGKLFSEDYYSSSIIEFIHNHIHLAAVTYLILGGIVGFFISYLI